MITPLNSRWMSNLTMAIGLILPFKSNRVVGVGVVAVIEIGGDIEIVMIGKGPDMMRMIGVVVGAVQGRVEGMGGAGVITVVIGMIMIGRGTIIRTGGGRHQAIIIEKHPDVMMVTDNTKGQIYTKVLYLQFLAYCLS